MRSPPGRPSVRPLMVLLTNREALGRGGSGCGGGASDQGGVLVNAGLDGVDGNNIRVFSLLREGGCVDGCHAGGAVVVRSKTIFLGNGCGVHRRKGSESEEGCGTHVVI